MNQARKPNFKTHVEKLNPISRTDLSNRTLSSKIAPGEEFILPKLIWSKAYPAYTSSKGNNKFVFRAKYFLGLKYGEN